ncbi:hypothetical protein ACFPRL_15285 [Pseudoclavibacter helvolus]
MAASPRAPSSTASPSSSPVRSSRTRPTSSLPDGMPASGCAIRSSA